ncbi:hypothetical protein, partial [Escherichia coli]|uniref:hypothetical protein n=1 Tax=Escherichia coli TaxID=562 RepID=UPI001371BB7C
FVRMLGGWGSPYPQIVFVGDRYNGPRDAHLPFSNKSGPSKTLSDLLNAAKLWERDLHFLNAYDPDGAPSLTSDALGILSAQEIV